MKMLYVRMTDKFMSGWGVAKNAVNVLVIGCENSEQAERIERNAHRRSEMKRVEICLNKPKARQGVIYTWKSYDDMGEVWKK
jgi:hypothetical protein